jgi:iron complex outermembrane receptor protein
MDLSVRQRLPLDVSLDANLAWLPTAKYRDFTSTDPLAPEYFDNNPLTGPPPVELKGRRLNRAPEISSTIGANYARPLVAGWDFDGRLELYTVSKQFYSPYVRPHDENAQDGYYSLNTYLTFRRGDSWTVRAYGRNLTDEFFLSGITENSATGHLFADYARPREFGVGLTYRFESLL